MSHIAGTPSSDDIPGDVPLVDDFDHSNSEAAEAYRQALATPDPWIRDRIKHIGAEHEREERRRLAEAPALQSVDFADYIASFEVADYIIDPIVQSGRVYSLTALTGHGKTAVMTTIAIALACDRNMGRLEMTAGLNTLILSGENDHDNKARQIATSQELGLHPETGRLRVIPGSYAIGGAIDAIKAEDERNGPFGLIVADTSIAFFGGDNENDNPQLRRHAYDFRMLSEQLPGKPAVLLLCHPVKNAARDNLLPRGGGAFVNELDGNLTVWRENDRISLHWQGKFRGPSFDPIHFQLKPRALTGFGDKKGRPVPSVVAVPIDDAAVEQLAREDWQDENRLLYVMSQAPTDSQGEWARSCTWITKGGDPLKSKVHRLLERLEKDGMVVNSRGKWSLTPAGKKEADRP